ncbi:MAG TPA: HAD family hydrolase [candidate division Zixibacteria bacterium]|nr:HAD family hydrolase [candidate division Zixibacteria bacterium]
MTDRLVLFDIDGTLTRTRNGFMPFNEAVSRVFGVAADIRSVVPDGNTDPLIVLEIFRKAGLEVETTPEKWASFARELAASYAEALSRGAVSVRALPGARELLAALAAEPAVGLGVVTGNLEAPAAIKLEAAGLRSYIACGAYASDSRYREELPPIARRRYERLAGRSIPAERCIIVGDTPKDLDCARKNAMRCLLVGTGRYPVEELRGYGPDACLPDLSDTEAVLSVLAKL